MPSPMHPISITDQTIPYSYDSTVNHSAPIEVIDTNAIPVTSEEYFVTEPNLQETNSQLIYTDQSVPNVPAIRSDLPETGMGTDMLYTQQPPFMLPEAPAQDDVDMEPIDLEEVQKIQARMPAADPNAPVGSSKNPIRIIQQGNQYITTQDVSDEHLQQIIQVLTNQALISSSSSRPSAIYNRLTNRRIIFRVTKAKRRNDDNIKRTSHTDRTRGSAKSKRRTPGRMGNRKRRKLDSDEEDPDFEPELPEEEVLPFPLARRTSTSGRVSKPPKHLIKDYKHLKLEDLTKKPGVSSGEDDHSDGGYSDYINDGASDAALSDDATKSRIQYPCSICNRTFNSRAGLSRHNTVLHSSTGSRGRTANPYVVNMKRRAKLQEAVSEATDDDLVEFVAPRLSKLLSPWDHLLFRSEDGTPPLPQIPKIFLDYLDLAERVRTFLNDHLQPRSQIPAEQTATETLPEPASEEVAEEKPKEPSSSPSPVEPAATSNGLPAELKDTTPEAEPTEPGGKEEEDDESIIVKVTTEDQSSILGLPLGDYTVVTSLKEEYLPRRFRSILAAQQVAMETGDAINGPDPLEDLSAVAEKTANGQVEVQPVPSKSTNDKQEKQPENVISLGNDLVLLPEGGLGGPVPEEWITSGSFLTVLTETGELSDLVLEAATGRLFHRPTGQLVNLADSGASADTSVNGVKHVDFGVYEDEETIDLEKTIQSTPTVTRKRASRKESHTKRTEEEPPAETASTDVADARQELLRKIAESGEMLDLNALFPGVSVTEVSPGVCLVTKPNGDRFNVEHGGEGITLETLQMILQMDP